PHPAPTEPSTLSLHDALPIFPAQAEVLTEALEAAAEPGDLLAAGPAQLTGQDIDRDVPAPSADQNRSDLARQTLDAARKMLGRRDRKSTRLNSSHVKISYAVF